MIDNIGNRNFVNAFYHHNGTNKRQHVHFKKVRITNPDPSKYQETALLHI